MKSRDVDLTWRHLHLSLLSRKFVNSFENIVKQRKEIKVCDKKLCFLMRLFSTYGNENTYSDSRKCISLRTHEVTRNTHRSIFQGWKLLIWFFSSEFTDALLGKSRAFFSFPRVLNNWRCRIFIYFVTMAFVVRLKSICARCVTL